VVTLLSLVVAMAVTIGRSVGRSVGRLVGWSVAKTHTVPTRHRDWGLRLSQG
jgi:hypothetical protein